MLRIKVAIIPVFYDVDPSDLRHVAKGKYANAFVQHRKKRRYNSEKIGEWEKALSSVSYLDGCIVDPLKCDEGKLSRKIVESALHHRKKVPLDVATFPVGLDEAVQDFESKVGSSTPSENVHIVGIVGMGGSGKTTLAKELYNRKCSSISRSCFISNVRDAASKKNLPSLQKFLLKSLGINPHSEFHDIHQGKGFLARDLRSMTVLIVLDDVDDVDQMDALLPIKDNLGRGSFVIVTTRELDVLTTWGISCNYSMKLLDPFNARQLFCRHAFLQPYSLSGFEFLNENYHNFQDLIKRFVEVCKGLPLSLKVLGAMVNGRTKSFWESQLQKISKILPGKIADCLKLSYEALDSEVQQMFLDITCFFIGEEKSLVIAIWYGSGWSSEVGLETLVNKCLVTLDNTDCIEMHDHLRDLGRGIAEDLSPSRIWKEEQLSDQEGRTRIRGIVFEGDYWSTLEHSMEKIRPSLRALQLLAVRGHDFREEFAALSRNVVWLRVRGFYGTNLPPWLSLGNLAVLELYDTTNLEELWQDNAQLPMQLRVLIIHILRGTSFRGLQRSIGRLTHLKKIVLLKKRGLKANDTGMRSLPQEFCGLKSLEFLELSGFPELSLLPDHFGKLTNLRRLALKHVKLMTLPNSFGNLTNLQTLSLKHVKLMTLPDSFGNLTNLQTLKLQLEGDQLMVLPDFFDKFTNLKTLKLEGEQLTALPDSLGNLTNLETLKLEGKQLTALPDSLGNLTNLKTLKLWRTALPDSLGNLINLHTLNLWGDQLTALPESLGNLTNLRSLYLLGDHLRALPESLGNLTNLQTLDLTGKELTALPDTLANLTNLQCLGLWGDHLTALPDSLGSLNNLQTLDLKGKQLTALPYSLGNLTNLQTLYLKGEPLTALPDFFGNFTNLQILRLEGMQLTALPDSLGNLTNLQGLYLWGDQLTALPDSIGNLTNLLSLDLKGEHLTALPDFFGNFTNLQALRLNGMQLTALPDSLGDLTNLRTLQTSGGQLTALPSSLGNLTNLQTLQSTGGWLTALPNSLANLTNLHTLRLMGRQLTALPDSLGNLTNLQTLLLFGGQLLDFSSLPLEEVKSTALLDFLVNLTNLQTLELGDVKLTALPDSFGNLTNLETLLLRGEQLTALPDSLGNLTNLRNLRLEGEQLTALPDFFSNFMNLQTLRLEGKQLMVLPDSLGNLTNLQTLYLKGNQLTALPDSLGNLTNLQILYLQEKHFTALPNSVCNLKNLQIRRFEDCERATLFRTT